MRKTTKTERRLTKREKLKMKQYKGATLSGMRARLAANKGLRGTAGKLARVQKNNRSNKQKIS